MQLAIEDVIESKGHSVSKTEMWLKLESIKDFLAGVTVGRGDEPKTKVFNRVVFIDICMFLKFANFKKDCWYANES